MKKRPPKLVRQPLQDNRIWFGPNGNSVPSMKRFLTELKFEGMAPTSILFYKEVGHSQEGAKELVSLMGDKAKDLDIGFRVFKLDSSNMEEVFYTPEDFDESHLFN